MTYIIVNIILLRINKYYSWSIYIIFFVFSLYLHFFTYLISLSMPSFVYLFSCLYIFIAYLISLSIHYFCLSIIHAFLCLYFLSPCIFFVYILTNSILFAIQIVQYPHKIFSNRVNLVIFLSINKGEPLQKNKTEEPFQC